MDASSLSSLDLESLPSIDIRAQANSLRDFAASLLCVKDQHCIQSIPFTTIIPFLENVIDFTHWVEETALSEVHTRSTTVEKFVREDAGGKWDSTVKEELDQEALRFDYIPDGDILKDILHDGFSEESPLDYATTVESTTPRSSTPTFTEGIRTPRMATSPLSSAAAATATATATATACVEIMRAPRIPSEKIEDVDFESLPDLCPSLETLGPNLRAFKVDWKGQPRYLGDDSQRHLLHPAEVSIASTLHMTCAQYLTTKRRIFKAKVELLLQGNPDFKKTHAQKATHIDVNKASRLWTAFDKVGWFGIEHFEKYIY